jgi:hypothetical protein
MDSIIPLILSGLIGIGVGLVIGNLFCSLRGERKTEESSHPTSQSSSVEIPHRVGPSILSRALNEPVQEETIKPQSMNVLDLMSRTIQPKKGDLQESPKSITAQIDEILQEMLNESEYKNQAIRLREDIGKGVVVMVGLEQYEGIEAVPDPEIRSMIRSAVSEWESRSSVQDRHT